MKAVTMFQTADGVVHGSQKLALSHLDTKYADILCAVSSKLAQIDKYTLTCDYIDANLNQFVQMDAIRKDMVLIAADSED